MDICVLEIRMLISCRYRETTSHLRVYDLLRGKVTESFPHVLFFKFLQLKTAMGYGKSVPGTGTSQHKGLGWRVPGTGEKQQGGLHSWNALGGGGEQEMQSKKEGACKLPQPLEDF